MTKAHGRRPSKNRMRDHLSGWLFVLPLLVVFLVFIGIPVFRTVFYLGFTDYNLMKDPAWVGLSNYEKLFTSDPNAADMWGATFRIPLYLIPLHVGLSLLIAFLVHSCRLKAVQYATRTLIYFPVLATTASVAIAWNYMFNENRGVINWLLQQVGILGPDQNVRWLISTETAMWAIVIFSAWKFIGQHFLYYFVGLQNIPDTYYEAAKIDGANSLQMFWKVTLPLITPTIFFILMVSLTGTMQAFDEPFFVTNGRAITLPTRRCISTARRSRPTTWAMPRRWLPYCSLSCSFSRFCSCGAKRNGWCMTMNKGTASMKRKKAAAKRAVSQGLIVLGCLLICLIWVLPFLWMLGTSMRREIDSFNLPPAFWPEQWNIENYQKVFDMIPFLKFTWNSFFISASATLAMLVVTSMAAYAFARINFAFKKIAFPILLSGMMIPVSSTLVPLFFTIRDLNLMDTQAAVILLGIYYPIGLLLLRQFMMTIPKSYDEAAYIDGASRLRIFWSIILPMSRSTMIVAAVLCFVVNWNNYLVPLVFLNSEGNYPLTLGMQFLKDSWTIDQTVMLAAVVLSVIPPAIVYITCQKFLLQGVITSGLKS